MKFRKKPIVIEAEQFTGNINLEGKFTRAIHLSDTRRAYVVTIHGDRAYLAVGDWIIPEPDGVHFYPCKPDIFAATYDAVQEGALQS
jgi:hypothetical protein